ncbi:Fanconi anemia group D2 protein-like [Limulus polyphemus]|uniref:Fanconi anemia group D2 protein-like n=1 Tax=Limulus polyphemus TaxID=6850 RepID=A0ABM1SW26_LIMPO|nr:Fanconi anemia group D2 protein-like [Limulus polyphemus]
MLHTKRKLSKTTDTSSSIPEKTLCQQRQPANGERDDEILKDETEFCQLITKAGYIFKTGGSANQLNVDQAVFQRDLRKSLKSHQNYPEVIDEFLETLRNLLEDPVRLRWSLMPTLTTPNSTSARGENQDSLIRLLLGIDLLQELTDKMLEMLEVVPTNFQCDIIASIPDIINDSDHSEVARRLCDLLLESRELRIPILDTLSNLNIPSETVTETRATVLKTLPSVEIEDLPVVIKFVLNNLKPEDAFEIISELRNNLDFKASFPPANSSTPRKKKNNLDFKASFPPANSSTPRKRKASDKTDRGAEFLTIDAFRSILRFQKTVCDNWIKVIETVKTPAEHKPLDLLLLILLHSLELRRKPVESLLRNKIRAGNFTEVLLQVTFGSHSEVLEEYSPSVLNIAEVLLKSLEPIISYFGSTLYQKAFVTFNTFCKQEVISNLVTHVGSGITAEVDAALDTLVVLGDQTTEKMASFGTFIKSILDFLDNLTLSQIKKVYTVLSVLAYQGGQEGHKLQDDISIMIRKQLTNTNPKYQRMGVIGALMASKSMAAAGTSTLTHSASTSSQEAVTTETQQKIVELLEMVRSSTARTPEAIVLFYDELSKVVLKGELESNVESWINETIINDFQEDFIVDIEPASSSNLMAVELKHGLDNLSGDDGGIALNLTPLLHKEENMTTGRGSFFSSKERVVSTITLASIFRLLRICEQSQHGSTLEGIDALLGCPVYLPQSSALAKFSTLSNAEKQLICTSYFHCLNWFREILNGFAMVGSAEIKEKVVLRLRDIVEMQKILQQLLGDFPVYKPPMINFDHDNLEVQIPIPFAGSSNKTGGKRGKKPAAKNVLLLFQTGDKTSEKVVDLSAYRVFFRELDLDVFVLLQNGLSLKISPEISNNDENDSNLKLGPSEIQFLLDDLTRKLDHSLLTSQWNRKTAFKSRIDKKLGFSNLDLYTPLEITTRMVELLPVLCQILEDTSAFFQAIIAENDGVLDGHTMFSGDAVLLASCMELLLHSLNRILSWNGFLKGENRQLHKQTLQVLATRIGTLEGSQTGTKELLRHAFHYLVKFSESLPTFSSSVMLTRLLETLLLQVEDKELREELVKVADSFLKRDWLGSDGLKEKGAKHNQNIETLLRIQFMNVEDALKHLETFSTIALEDLVAEAGKKNVCSSVYPTLNRSTYSTFYKSFFHYLVDVVKSSACQAGENREAHQKCLQNWLQVVKVFKLLVDQIKIFGGRPVLASSMKYGRQLVESFKGQAVPLLNRLFRTHKEDVLNLLKNLQASTRYLQHVCNYVKGSKDAGLTRLVPPLRKSLESIIYLIMAMMAENKCKGAFWIGNLKNRDLQGNEILSQSTQNSVSVASNENQSEESDVIPDDDQSDVELEEETHTGSPALSEKQTKEGLADEDQEYESEDF